MLSQWMKIYSDGPYHKFDGLTDEKREHMREAYARALQETGAVDAIRTNQEKSVLLFSGANTGINDIEILRRLDPLLKGKRREDVVAVLSDLTVKPSLTDAAGETVRFTHITPHALQLNAADLDEFASAKPLVLCERLGALWHAAYVDVFRNRDYGVEGESKYPQRMVDLLKIYHTILGTHGVLILDSNQLSTDAVSTWEKMQEAARPENEVLEDFLERELGITVERLPTHKGVELVALRFKA